MTWYTLISAVPSPGTNELIHLALYVRSGEDGMVYVSENRLKSLNAIMPPANAAAAKNIVRDMQRRWEKSVQVGKMMSFLDDFNPERFIYLSKYSNNILSYSEPTEISLAYSNELNHNLITRFFNERPNAAKPPRNRKFTSYAHRFFAQFQSKVNLNYDIKMEDLSTLVAPVKVDLIGRNERPYISQSIDFSSTIQTIAQKAKDLQALHHAFADIQEQPVIHILSEEPEKHSENHQIWQRVRDLKYLHIVPKAEDQMIADYIHEHGVSFFK